MDKALEREAYHPKKSIMELSRFNCWVKDHPGKGDYLLFNCRTQGLIRVNPEFKAALESLGAGIVPELLTPHILALKQNGMIVEDRAEDESKLRDFFRQLKAGPCGLSFEVNILTTYNCNFRCVYCFEEGARSRARLNKKTSELVVRWLKDYILARGLTKLYVVYYGGEPLLNTFPIYGISGELKEWAGVNKIDFAFGIITNGSLITPKLVEELLPLGLRDIRVTLDGPAEVHDRMRPFCDGSATFNRIIENIKSVIGKVNVGIAGNFDRRSFPAIPRLLDYLKEEGLFERLGELNFAPITPRLGPKGSPASIELSECMSFIDDKDGLFEETVLMKRELARRGKTPASGLNINACPLFMQDIGLTIDPKGDIYKCNSLLGHQEFSVGNVRQKGFNGKFEMFRNIDAWEKCSDDCPYVPMCQGGCRFFSYIENKNFTDLFCRREYFDRIIPELIKLEYNNLAQARQAAAGKQ